jgi:hypothetical protein
VDHHNWLHHQSQLHQPVAHLNELILCRFSYDFEGLDVHAHKRLFTAKNGHSRKLHGISLFFHGRFTVYPRHHFYLIWLQRVAMLFSCFFLVYELAISLGNHVSRKRTEIQWPSHKTYDFIKSTFELSMLSFHLGSTGVGGDGGELPILW